MKRNKLLYPFSLIYQLIIGIRNFLFDYGVFKSVEFPIAVISVGNITVGGTGKTPHVLYLINLLKKKYTLATLSRGYKRKTKGFIQSNINSTSSEIGDEPKLIKQINPEIIVAVDANRVSGINSLQNKNKDLEVVLLDDAYQHRWLKPSLSILLIDYSRPLDEDSYLPYGNLRESKSQISRANIVLITKSPKELKPMSQRVISVNLKLYPYQNLFFTYMEYQNLRNVFNSEKEQTIDSINEEYELLVITGIANPTNMIDYLAKTKAKINHIKFADHQSFQDTDILNIIDRFNGISAKKKCIITTEKDAMRINEFSSFAEEIKEPFFFLPIEVKFLENQELEFNKLISSHLTVNYKKNDNKRSTRKD